MFSSLISRGLIFVTSIVLAALALTWTQHLPRARALTCLPPPSGMVNWWPGDNNANDIQGSNNGTLQNGATFASGKVAQAFSFDGVDDFVDVGNVQALNSFTVDAWVFINPATNIGGRTVVSNTLLSMPQVGFALNTSIAGNDGQASFFMRLNPDNASETWDAILAPTALTAGWHHLAGVRDLSAGQLRLYVDGALVASAAVFLTGTTAVTNTVIGKAAPLFHVLGGPYAGLIDEVEIFNRALSTGEIQAIYNADSAGKCKGGGGAEADLAITKSDGRTTALPGETVTYTINVVNNSPNALTGVTVTDNFPAAITGVTWTCAAASGSSCGSSGGSGNINQLVNLGAFGSVTFTATGTVSGSASGVISNTATVAPPGSITDPDLTNNSATDNTTVGTSLADLTMTKSAPASTFRNATLTYGLTVRNLGAGTATGVTAVDTLPSGVLFLSATPSQGSCSFNPLNRTVTCNLGTINAPSPTINRATVTIRVRVLVGSGTTLVNTASVSGDQTDPSTRNNISRTSTVSTGP